MGVPLSAPGRKEVGSLKIALERWRYPDVSSKAIYLRSDSHGSYGHTVFNPGPVRLHSRSKQVRAGPDAILGASNYWNVRGGFIGVVAFGGFFLSCSL